MWPRWLNEGRGREEENGEMNDRVKGKISSLSMSERPEGQRMGERRGGGGGGLMEGRDKI